MTPFMYKGQPVQVLESDPDIDLDTGEIIPNGLHMVKIKITATGETMWIRESELK